MTERNYETEFFVRTVPKRENMLLMNINLYDIKKQEPAKRGPDIALGSNSFETRCIRKNGKLDSAVWCAVYYL